DAPSRGFDCSGFTCYVMRSANISLPRTSHEQAKLGQKKRVSEVETGDLIFFGHGSRVTHVAIVLGRGRNRIDVVHSTSSRGVVRDNILGSEYWRNRTLWAIDLSDL
ncbi:MAG: C40 family peptidase, partial [Saprospiraceae bacterium]|nr:C40 family peptidase [Saprospiraceae bacterium]